jgi:hypothetical protein
MALKLSLALSGLRLAATASVLALAVTAVHAQEVAGTIRGDVQDDAGNPLPGATVTITHVPSGTRSVQTTDASGSFSAPNLRIGGPFDIEVTADGFDPAKATIDSLQAGQPQRLSVALAIEAIEVTAARVAPSSIVIATGPATSLDAREISSIANVNRDIRNLAARDPLVTLDPTNGGAISIAGQNNRFNRITVDGVAFGDPFGLEAGGLASARGSVPLDAIAEFTVETAPVDIQQGGFQGGAINTVLKSGSNSFDLNGFYTYTDDSLGGTRTRSTPTNPSGRVSRDFESKIFGMQVTGPLIKDKLFFAVTYEGLRDQTPATIGVAGEGFANSVPNLTRATVDRIKSVADAVYDYDTLDVPSNAEERDDKLVAKLDWNIADGHRASFTYIYNKGDLLAGLGNSSISTTTPTLALQSNNYTQGAINHYGVLQLNNEWAEGFSTQARVSYHDYKRLQVPFNGREFGQFVVCGSETRDATTQAALINCPTGQARVQFGPDISRQANELFVKTLGIELQARIQGGGHDVKFIAERRGQDIDNLFAQRVSGDWFFDTIADLEAQRANRVDIAAPIRGDIDTTRALFENNVFTFGVQDTWDILDDVTLIYGARYDLYQTDDRPVANTAFIGRYGFGNNSTLNGRDVVQPRFGINWRAAERLRLRASAGLFAGGSPNVWISNSYSNPGPLLGRIQVERTALGVGGAPDTFRILGLTGVSAAEQNRLGALTLNGVTGGTGVPGELITLIQASGSALADTNSLDPRFQIPSQWRLAGTVDYNANLGPLGDDWRFSGSVIWSRVKDALTWTDLRSVQNTVQSVLPDGRARYQGLGGSTATNADIFLTNTGRGYSWNIVGGFDKGFDMGLSVGGSLTFQRAKDVNPGTSSVAFSNYDNTVFGGDPNNSQYGTSNYQIDNSYRLRVGYDAELFGDNATRFELFFNSRSGLRYSHTMFETGSGRSVIFGVPGNRARNLLYVPDLSSITADPIVAYVDTVSSGVVTQTAQQAYEGLRDFVEANGLSRYQGRVVPKNLGRSPRYNKLDFSVRQEIPFFLGGKLELFGDIENVLNLINRDWGSLRQVGFPYRATLVNVSCRQTPGGAPTTSAAQPCAQYVYSNFQNPNVQLQTNPSLWQIRLGVRLGFRGFNFN